jgi:hypothetical protein
MIQFDRRRALVGTAGLPIHPSPLRSTLGVTYLPY